MSLQITPWVYFLLERWIRVSRNIVYDTNLIFYLKDKLPALFFSHHTFFHFFPPTDDEEDYEQESKHFLRPAAHEAWRQVIIVRSAIMLIPESNKLATPRWTQLTEHCYLFV